MPKGYLKSLKPLLSIAFVVGVWSHQKGNLGTNEKTSIEGIIAPGVLTLLSAVLCYGLADKIYS